MNFKLKQLPYNILFLWPTQASPLIDQLIVCCVKQMFLQGSLRSAVETIASQQSTYQTAFPVSWGQKGVTCMLFPILASLCVYGQTITNTCVQSIPCIFISWWCREVRQLDGIRLAVCHVCPACLTALQLIGSPDCLASQSGIKLWTAGVNCKFVT